MLRPAFAGGKNFLNPFIRNPFSEQIPHTADKNSRGNEAAGGIFQRKRGKGGSETFGVGRAAGVLALFIRQLCWPGKAEAAGGSGLLDDAGVSFCIRHGALHCMGPKSLDEAAGVTVFATMATSGDGVP